MRGVTFLLIPAFIMSISIAFKQVRHAAKFGRFLSIRGGAAVSDSDRPFYALGVNIALQVGGELKDMLSKEELVTVIQGFTESMQGTAGDEKALLKQYGPALNEMLQSRAGKALDGIKQKGTGYTFENKNYSKFENKCFKYFLF